MTDLTLIWWTLGHVTDTVFNCDIHNTSKEVFRPKSATLPELKNCQNANFEPLHEIQKKKLLKDYF